MSFSYQVKEELSKIENLSNKQIVKSELLGYLLTSNVSIQDTKIKFSTESKYNINRFGKLLNNLNINNYDIDIKGNNFTILLNSIYIQNLCGNKPILDILEHYTNIENMEKAVVRGCFLGSGSINNPENFYHLEIKFHKIEEAEFVEQILENYNIHFKILNKNKNCYIYTKDGEEISKFLVFTGANNGMLKFEEIRVYRDVKNNVNRKVNCETANLTKTINAALKQMEDIQLIKKMGKFEILPDNLKELANLRMKNPEASLIELGNMLTNPIGKSGVNNRFKHIHKIAEEISKFS